MYNNFTDMMKLCNIKAWDLRDLILENEMMNFSKSKNEIFDELLRRYHVMEHSASVALSKKLKTVGGLISGVSEKQYQYTAKNDCLCGAFVNLVMTRALACSEYNASMGRICAAPTAGACGILPAVLITVAEQYELSDKQICDALLVASGVGAVIMKNATVSGAEGGCQAECGVAAAMSSAALVYIKGGSTQQIFNSISLCLMNCMGLICDPVAGLVQFPCAQRNASQAVNALLSADLALSGMRIIIPVDEVVEAMYKVGRQLPLVLRETALGGLAGTPTGKKIKYDIFHVSDDD